MFDNLWDLTKPATVLVEKISAATWVLYEPTHIKRKIKAEADGQQYKELKELETQMLKHKWMEWFLAEEVKKQNNIESIVQKALPSVDEWASAENIEDDWVTNFFDKSKLTSDDEMKDIWASILAWEANKPGSFSKRTVNFMQSLDKNDALLFTKLCSFVVEFWSLQPIILNLKSDIYMNNWIDFSVLKHLDWIWLISYSSVSGYRKNNLLKFAQIFIWKDRKQALMFKFWEESWNYLPTWKVLFTSVGMELAKICTPESVEWFKEYLLEEFKKETNVIKIDAHNFS